MIEHISNISNISFITDNCLYACFEGYTSMLRRSDDFTITIPYDNKYMRVLSCKMYNLIRIIFEIRI